MPASRPSTIPPPVEVRIPTPRPGEVSVVRVTIRRVATTPSGPGIAARLVETEGEPTGEWAEVVDLDAARDRRSA